MSLGRSRSRCAWSPGAVEGEIVDLMAFALDTVAGGEEQAKLGGEVVLTADVGDCERAAVDSVGALEKEFAAKRQLGSDRLLDEVASKPVISLAGRGIESVASASIGRPASRTFL